MDQFKENYKDINNISNYAVEAELGFSYFLQDAFFKKNGDINNTPLDLNELKLKNYVQTMQKYKDEIGGDASEYLSSFITFDLSPELKKLDENSKAIVKNNILILNEYIKNVKEGKEETLSAKERRRKYRNN